MAVSYCKLRDGSWGLKGEGIQQDSEVTVTTKAGKTKTEKVGKIIWQKDKLMIATIYKPEVRKEYCECCGVKFTCGCSPEEEVPF